ncbi:MAG: GTP cyclohydrolase MptA [Thermoplasmatota archaeon]
MKLPDVQAFRSVHPFHLNRVGITGVVKPLRVHRRGVTRELVGSFDAYVDLPAEQRGIHMSRSVEAINQTIDALARETTGGLEELASRIATTLLERHEYAKTAEVSVEAPYFRERRTPANHAATLERYDLFASATGTRDAGIEAGIGVEVVGMTACPCAMEGTREILAQRGIKIEGIPTVTHNQRNRVSLFIEGKMPLPVDADDLIDLVEESLSAPTYELLKRGDETALVLQAHENPRFVEDVVREALARVAKRYAHLPAETFVVARSEAEESIHKHNAFCERVATVGELLS